MTDSEKFINWLDGYLDACKNNVRPAQVRHIKKKIKDCLALNKNTSNVGPLWHTTTNPLDAIDYTAGSSVTTNILYDSTTQPVSDEFLEEIEKNKNASTMEDLDL
jgi:hypothetical protein